MKINNILQTQHTRWIPAFAGYDTEECRNDEEVARMTYRTLRFYTRLMCVLFMALCYFVSNSALAANKGDDYVYNYAALNNRCQVYDPYEPLNRKVFMVNSVLDAFILRPITKTYNKLTNDYTKARVGSFVSNINEPLSSLNYVVQGNPGGAFKTFWRFAINSTFGVLGLFDVASKFDDLTAKPQTFGSTLAHYGVGQGPYIVLPLYGGMGARDVMDPIVMNNAMNIIKYPMHSDFKWTVTGISTVHSRNQIMPFTDYVSQNSPDPYIAIRDAILSNKEAKMGYPVEFKCPAVNNK